MTIDNLKENVVRHHLSIAAQSKVKNGANFETNVESLLKFYKLVPQIKDSKGRDYSLKTSPFRTQKVPLNINNQYSVSTKVHEKIIDFWIPKHKLFIECTTGISDGKEKELYLVQQSINIQYRDSEYVVFVEYPPSPIVSERLKNAGIEVICGIKNIDSYLQKLSITPVMFKKLNIGKIEYHSLKNLLKNDVNREININHVWKIVESILTVLQHSGTQVGLIRPFVAIRSDEGELILVDAHHLYYAVEIIRDQYGYDIDKVPVMVLEHLSKIHPEEVSQILSYINTIVLNWDDFAFVKTWLATYKKSENVLMHYSYSTLYDDMMEISEKTRSNSKNKGGGIILPAYCVTDIKSIPKWASNLDLMRRGELKFDEKHYNSCLKPIKLATITLIDSIENHLKAMKSHQNYKKGKLVITRNSDIETVDLISMNSNFLRQFATSLKSLYFTNPDLFSEVVPKMDSEFWKRAGLTTNSSINPKQNGLEFTKLVNFPKNNDDLKKAIEGEFLNNKYFSGKLISFIN